MEVELGAENYGRFVVEPLPSGFGTTLGNAIRRVLLSSLPGAAVTSVHIEGVQHEFSTIPHMAEDTIEFLLNIKEIRFRAFSDRPGKLILDVAGEGEITAADIRPTADYEVTNPELHLATLDSPEARLVVELSVERGTGYVPAGGSDGLPIGVIPVDAIFTPVPRANFRVERTRVGQVTNYDSLILEVWTDGTIAPQEAVSQAARILRDHLDIFDAGRATARLATKAAVRDVSLTAEQYNTPIEQLGLSVRAYNCLKRSGISKVGEILQMSDEDLMAVKNFGRKSLDELQERLVAVGFIQRQASQAKLADSTSVTEGDEIADPPVAGEDELPEAEDLEKEDEEAIAEELTSWVEEDDENALLKEEEE